MRTTLDLDDRVLSAATRQAQDRGESLEHFIEDAIRLQLMEAPRQKPFRLELLTKKGVGGSTIAWEDRNALYSLMEEDEP